MSGLRVDIDRLVYPGASQPVLDSFQLTVRPGEFLAVLGPSGCGKTSLLNAIAGLNPHFSGDIQFDGSRIGFGQGAPGMGCMFQEPRLMPWLTVAANIALVLDDDVASLQRHTFREERSQSDALLFYGRSKEQ